MRLKHLRRKHSFFGRSARPVPPIADLGAHRLRRGVASATSRFRDVKWWFANAVLASFSVPACAPQEPEPPPIPLDGGTVARGFGVSIRGIAYVPDDRVQSFGLVSACEPSDGSTCGDHAWSAGEQDALARAA